MSIGDEKKLLKATGTYFIPVGVSHNWKTMASAANILDVGVKWD